MKNLKSYQDDSFEFYKEVISRIYVTKSDPKYKDRILALNNDVQKRYNLYKNHLDDDSLELLNSNNYNEKNKNDLISLYAYRSKSIQKLKIKLTTDEHNRIINTCQNCTIGEISSFDHILPKEEFAEYSVNPQNLFPSCSICNGHKSKIWKSEGKRIFLNLYLDKLPHVQYLFVKIFVENNCIKTHFYLENRNGVEDNLYERILNHYSRLKLCERYNQNIDSVVTPFLSSITSHINILPIDEIIKLAIETSERNKLAYGSNYWKSILEIELMTNTDFISQYIIPMKH